VPVATTSKVAVWPAMTLWFAGCVVMEGPATALPLRESVRDESEASLENTRLPLELPCAVGANSILTGRLFPGVMETEDIAPTTLKPGPKTAAWEIVTAAVPVFVRVTVCMLFEPGATLPKLILVALAASTPADALFEVVFPGVPALVSPTQPEIDKVVSNSVPRMANSVG
jgi:hypothetical protein